jgi:two-component system, NtrC family, sensor histidine kinase GlrK
MRLNIFSRFFFGYFVIILVFGAITAYSVFAVHHLNDQVEMVFNYDQRIIDDKKQLVDLLISQVESRKGFIVTGEASLLSEIVEGQREFDRKISQLTSIVSDPGKRKLLEKAGSYYADYKTAVNEEIEMAITGKRYSRVIYSRKNEIALNNVLRELRMLETLYEDDARLRLRNIRQTSATAQQVSITLFVGVLFIIIFGAVISTKSITQPLKLVMDKTKEVSRGVFKGDLAINSPSEVSELAGELNRMCEKLKEVDTMKSGFFAAMSHELRTPLASIKQGISLLRDRMGGSMPEKQKRLFAILSEETSRLIDIVNSLLEFSKLEAGMLPFALRKDDLPALVQKVIGEMAPLIEAKKIDLRMKSGNGGPVPSVNLDRERILQALRNLIGNALKFTPVNGEIFIDIYTQSTFVECSVKDNGPGIPKEHIGLVFEKFHQLPQQTSGGMKGTGLGLAFVKHIISAHGGSVWVASTPGEGSTFFFSLPLTEDPVTEHI